MIQENKDTLTALKDSIRRFGIKTVSRAVGVSRQTLYGFLKEDSKPSFNLVMRLAKHFNMEIKL